MNQKEMWRKLFGYQVGDYIKYLWVSSYGGREMIYGQIIELTDQGELAKIKVLRGFEDDHLEDFLLRIGHVAREYPERLKLYTPRRRKNARV